MIYNKISMHKNRNFEFCSSYTYIHPQKHPSRKMNYHDLVYVTKGSITVTQDDCEVTVGENEILFLTGHHKHYSDVINPSGTSCFFIHFNVFEKDSILSDKVLSQDDFVCIPMKGMIQNSKTISSLFKELIYYFNTNLHHKNKICSNLLYRILIEIEMNHEIDDLYHDELVTNIVNLINNNLSKNYKVIDFSELYFLSERTIQSRFKKATNTTIHQYMLNQKLNAAKKLLLSYPNLSIQEVAYHYGFYDAYHFSRLFKKKYHISPSQYRLKIK